MPVCHLETIGQGVTWGIWDISEEEEDLLGLHPAHAADSELRAIKPPQRRKQWLASRVLLRQILAKNSFEYQGVFKDSHRKAWLNGHPGHISIAHSGHLAMAIFDKHKPTGIDVESVKPRILKIGPKFMHPEELLRTANDPDEMTVYWCAKEALYKHYGRRMIFFKSELRVYRAPGEKTFWGVIHKDGKSEEVPLSLHRKDGFVIVYVC